MRDEETRLATGTFSSGSHHPAPPRTPSDHHRRKPSAPPKAFSVDIRPGRAWRGWQSGSRVPAGAAPLPTLRCGPWVCVRPPQRAGPVSLSLGREYR